MAETTMQSTTAEVPVEAGAQKASGPIEISGQLMVLTYITFAITAVVLYKVAWKPILNALDKREETLRKAVENAEKTRLELEQIEQTRSKLINDADAQARDIIEKARAGAVEVAHAIEEQAREEAKILIENARREIHIEQDKARSQLRRESAGLAIDISRRILQDNLDEARSRKLADSLISQI